MAKSPLPNVEPMYAAAKEFVERALARDDSLFTPGRPIWSAQVVQDVYERFVGNPDTSSDTFETKFRRQLSGAPATTIQAAGELLYVYLLPPVEIKGSTKRQQIETVLSWSPSPVALPDELKPALDQGFAKVGPAYLIRKPFQLSVFLEFLRKWKAMTDGERESALLDPWALKEVLFSVEHHTGYAQREALLNLFFPDTFEPIVSRKHKKGIVEGFAGLIDEDIEDIDKRILLIRNELEQRHGRPMDFYDEGIRKQWLPEDGGGPLLEAITDLLESRSLDDPDLRSHQAWRKTILPVTRPLLKQIAEELDAEDTEVKFYTGGNVSAKRDGYDRFTVTAGVFYAFASVGVADEPPGELEKMLCWGISSWGNNDSADERLNRLRELAPPDFKLRAIDGIKAINFGGTYVTLYKAIPPEDLRTRSEDELTDEIASDLRMLIEKVSGDGIPSATPRVWIEKTKVKGRPHRQEGDYAVGRAIWSPQRSRGGGDIYRFMRDIEPGDIVLHLTNDTAFTGVSRAAGNCEEYEEAPSEVLKDEYKGERGTYLVRLRDFEAKEPPLSRDAFFGSPYRERLVALIDAGTKNLFYTRVPALREGAHLTPAPTELVRILNDAYQDLAGRPLVEISDSPEPSGGPRPEEGRSLLVGAVPSPNDSAARMRREIESRGKTTTWWSYPLTGEKEQAVAEWRYLYWYSGKPAQQLVYRCHVVEYETSVGDEGIPCPWPEFVEKELRDKTREGPRKPDIFKTWFLVDSVEEVRPPIRLDELKKSDGTLADPSSLVNSFGVWRLGKDRKPSSLDELIEVTNLTRQELLELDDLLRRKRQVILEGPPGSGKTYVAEKFGRYFTGNPLGDDHDERLVMIQFHQSYGYEDFIQGIRPETNDAGRLEYHVQPGIFKRLCEVAERNRGKRFVIVIDEINRGNISRILGELLLLFEYRDKSIPLPYSRPDEPKFSIPPNVHVIGTMNTTDRSLAQIDYALRRRFYFYRLTLVENGRAPVLERWLQKQGMKLADQQRVLRLFISLNERVEQELSEHFQVGHSYFMDTDIATEAGLRRVWNRSIMPLLEEYFYNRRERRELLEEFEPGRLLAEGDEDKAGPADEEEPGETEASGGPD